MGGSSGSSTPQPAASIPQPRPAWKEINDFYKKSLPQVYASSSEYDPKFAALNLKTLQEFGPQYDAYLKQQQEALTPETAKIQEGLASLVNQGAGYGANVNGVPAILQSAYLDTLRSEIGGNAGSGIGADYVSRGLAQLGEQYKQNYQNLGLSLLQRQPVQSAMMQTPMKNYESGLAPALNYGASTYGSYVGGLSQMPYYTNQKKGFNWGGAGAGFLAGGIAGAPMGPLGIAGGALGGAYLGGQM